MALINRALAGRIEQGLKEAVKAGVPSLEIGAPTSITTHTPLPRLEEPLTGMAVMDLHLMCEYARADEIESAPE